MANETQAMPAPGTYFATNNGASDALAMVAAIKSSPLDEVTAYGVCELSKEVWKAESDVQKAIQVQTNLINVNNLNLHNRLCESEKAAIEAKYESKLETRDAVVKINEKIDHEVEEVAEQLSAFEKDTAEKFCDVEKLIIKGFDDLKLREKDEEIRELKRELSEGDSAKQTADIISAVLAAIGVTKKV